MSKTLIVSIHQPNYIPWLGFFFKIYCSDVFIIMDDVEYTSSSLTKRVKIRKNWNSNDTGYLFVPIEKPSNSTRIMDVVIKQSEDWQSRQYGQLKSVYSKTPYFKDYMDWFSSLNNDLLGVTRLSDLNIALIKGVMKELNLDTKLVKSSELNCFGSKSEYVITLIKEVGGTIYISGTGAKKYQKEDDFTVEGIQLVYNNFFGYHETHPYFQHQGSQFIPGLSVLDALFNIGAGEIKEMFEEARSSLSF